MCLYIYIYIYTLCMCVYICMYIWLFGIMVFYELVNLRYFRCILGVHESENLLSTSLKISGFHFSKICNLFLMLVIWFDLRIDWRLSTILETSKKIKSKTRVMSSNPRVTSSNPRITSSNPRVRVQIYELRVQIHELEFKSTSYEFKSTS